MHQVRFFCQERRNLSDLEAEVNRWLRETGAKVVNVFGNISGREVLATPEWARHATGARRESLERYVQQLTELQDIALSQQGVAEAHAIQAGREVRVMVDAKKVSDDQAQLIAYNIAKKVSEEMTFPGEIKVTVLRETRGGVCEVGRSASWILVPVLEQLFR